MSSHKDKMCNSPGICNKSKYVQLTTWPQYSKSGQKCNENFTNGQIISLSNWKIKQTKIVYNGEFLTWPYM